MFCLLRKSGSDDSSEQTNSSKRHRDKLNTELEQLKGILPLPSDISSRLDKLSVLRLTVSYLHIKAYLSSVLQSCSEEHALQNTTVPEGELMLKALNGFVLVVKEDGIILYTSHNIHDLLGYLQTDLINQNVLELVHTEDRATFTEQLSSEWRGSTEVEHESSTSSHNNHFLCDLALPHSAPCSLERNFVCRMRCLLEPSSGFLLMRIQGRMKPLPRMCSGVPVCFGLFATAVPVHAPSIVEIRTRSTVFRTKVKLDFTPITLDKKGQEILGWTEENFKSNTGYFYIHQEDLLYCAERHMNIFRTGELVGSVFRLLSKDKNWVWISNTARVIYQDGQPDFIVTTCRVISDAEGEEHFVRRSRETCFVLDRRSVLYGVANMLGLESATFIEQIEEEQASRRTSICPPSTRDPREVEEGLGYECRPAIVGGLPQPWPCIPSDMSIWELLWWYGLCQEDLEVIQQDQNICSLSSTELTDPLVPSTAAPSCHHASPGATPL